MPGNDIRSAIEQAVRALLRDIDAGVPWLAFHVAGNPGLDDPRRIEDPAANAVWNLADQVADAVGHFFTVVDHGIPVPDAIEMLRQVVDEPAWNLESLDARLAKFEWR